MMSARPLWQVSVVVDAADEALVVGLLTQVFREAVSSYEDFELAEVRASVYCASPPGAACLRLLDRALAEFPSRQREIKPRSEVRILRPKDWVNAWKRHFKPMTIRGCLLVKPSWSKKRPGARQRAVILDPGLSFGTGQHPTTLFCLDRVAAFRPVADAKSLFDIGTGSGILAIAARKLGYQPVDAIDLDPTAVRIASANARRNRVEVGIVRGDAGKMRSKSGDGYDVVCANLTSNLLLRHAARLTRQVKPGGALILAGILKTEFHLVRQVYAKLGWRLTATKAVGEWQSGSFVAI
jgi:ribosomal protein L11 methyltransferase